MECNIERMKEQEGKDHGYLNRYLLNYQSYPYKCIKDTPTNNFNKKNNSKYLYNIFKSIILFIA